MVCTTEWSGRPSWLPLVLLGSAKRHRWAPKGWECIDAWWTYYVKLLGTQACISFYIGCDELQRWLWTFAWNALHTSMHPCTILYSWVCVSVNFAWAIWPKEVSVCLASGRTWKVRTDASSTVQCLKLEIQESLGSPSHFPAGWGSNSHQYLILQSSGNSTWGTSTKCTV